MIAYDFEYYRPQTYLDAIEIYEQKTQEGKAPIYYGGGTEVITFARKGLIKTGAVIDLKEISECLEFYESNDRIIYGAALTLNELAEETTFKFMAHVSNRIADHTVRNRLSLGGNICGRLFYREAILPLLLTEATIVVAGKDGIKRVPILELFDKRMNLQKGEILLQVEVDKKYVAMPFINKRKEKQGQIDYPLFHLAMLEVDGHKRVAFSGICPYPFRSLELENILNDSSMTYEERANYSVKNLPTSIVNDIYASNDFREFLLKDEIINSLRELEGDK
jgi:CO/xanthine dehydrogenase FAD-binding subunit